LLHGDCLDVLRTLPSASVDAVVTDPPYGLAFMGKRWDYDVPSVEVWQECLRVLKPGGHLLAFAGTRTQHRMAVRIEDAGFEIRDMIAWVYGSGFPKSLDVSKAIDKAAGAEREVIGPNPNSRPNMVRVEASVLAPRVDAPLTAPATDTARQWQGWGTALKPALEPITVARKPLAGTVAENVLAHGTGALNVDGCRVGTDKIVTRVSGGKGFGSNFRDDGWLPPSESYSQTNSGRWPANLIHDGSDEVVELFPVTTSGGGDKHGRKASTFCASTGWEAFKGTSNGGDTGSAARFFYCAKTSKRDRGDDNNHPTVKPTDLMRYLCRLVTPPGGVVLDPFMGSGSTGKAAVAEGFCFIGIEREAEYLEIARRRIVEPDPEAAACQQGLF
jgi:site-specific DNA-methyltransferase (adenine-specific)